MSKIKDLARQPDFELGDLRVSPARRHVDGPAGSRHVEPQFMLVFLRLLQSAGQVVTRIELFEECWGGALVGDDSLNRAVAGARQIALALGSDAFRIETVPRTGYLLRLAPGIDLVRWAGAQQQSVEIELQTAVEEAYDCWRTGLPKPDIEAIAALEQALSADRGDSRAWGIYALLLRKAAEYAEPEECASFVRRCEQAARRALSLAPSQSDALVALTGVIPIFGNWAGARTQLTAVLEADPDHVPAGHDLAILEMATGRPSAAAPIIEDLIARDPLAATFYYKRMYHLWTMGEIAELDRVAARALQLWPNHPAIWSARLWSLRFTDRAEQALRLLEDDAYRPPMPPPALDLLRQTCAVAATVQRGEEVDLEMRRRAISLAIAASGRGPAQSVAAIISLCSLEAVPEAFDVAYGYYLGQGRVIAPLIRGSGDLSITDQHRRVTQPLFIPAARCMRENRRFPRLCDDLGLTAYWQKFGLTPDFLSDR